MQRLSDLTQSVSVLPKGTAFFRYCRQIGLTKGSYGAATPPSYASTPIVADVLRSGLYGMGAEIRWKAAVAAGSTSDSASDAPLVQYTNLVSEFVELLRPATILGRLTGARHVPMNVRFPRETGGVSAGWVAEGAATPASAMAFDSVTLGFAKIAGIVVLTKELAEFSGPAADSLLGAELLHATAAFMDSAFIDPGRAAVADTSPASITNGITPVQSSGSTATEIANDLAEMVGTMGDAGVPMTAPVWIMRPSDAAKLAGKVGSSGNSAFPDIHVRGGMLQGIPVLTSSSVPASVSGGSVVVLLDASQIDLADAGPLLVDSSSEAVLQMDTQPSNSAASSISLWQSGLVAWRLTKFLNWIRRHDEAVAYLDNVHW